VTPTYERKIKSSYPLAQDQTWGTYVDFRDVTRSLIAGYYRGKSTVSMTDLCASSPTHRP
jgi:hypothetical protein